MNNLKAKLKKQGGFTLIEMLIVVAIIAILIAISIPMVNRALENARESTDEANERAALGAAMVEVLGENTLATQTVTGTTNLVAYYEITNSRGTLKTAASSPTGTAGYDYGKGTQLKVRSTANNAGKCIKVTYVLATAGYDVVVDSVTTHYSAGDFVVEWV